MAKTYDPNFHDWCMVEGDEHRRIRHIVLALLGNAGEERVWIDADYADEIADAVQVGDGLTNGYAHDGARILSVPAARCAFYTDTEAQQIIAVEDADARLLSYARG